MAVHSHIADGDHADKSTGHERMTLLCYINKYNGNVPITVFDGNDNKPYILRKLSEVLFYISDNHDIGPHWYVYADGRVAHVSICRRHFQPARRTWKYVNEQ